METIIQSAADTRQEPALKTESAAVRIGYILLALSFALFAVCEYLDRSESSDFGLFVFHYFIVIIYLAVLLYYQAFGIRTCWQKQHLDSTVIMSNLALVSAFALNRELPVFEDSVPWLSAYLVLASLTLLSYRYAGRLPAYAQRIQAGLLGAALVLYLYLALYVVPIYLFGAVGMIVLGVGGHIFVPLGLIACCIFVMIHHKHHLLWRWVAAGAAPVLLFAAGFAVEWSARAQKIETVVNQSVLNPDLELPAWVKLAETLKNDWITLRLLKSDLVYTTHQGFDQGFMPGRTSLDERRQHDPLVFVSTLVRKISLDREDRLKALQAVSDSRNRSAERLWRGDNLATSYIVSDVDIYPSLRIAYTEKYLNIRNSHVPGWWGSTQEAIYTFQLPEGSVITSLSLWIGGKEQKGILTSRGKAAQAYREVVGVEMRDPSVVHWQEGNTVTVRVFPCTPEEERKFKIGITSPLVETGGQLHYRTMTFQGPATFNARETYRVRFPEAAETAENALPGYFRKGANGEFMAEGAYDPDFGLSFPAVPIRENHFTFDGYTYTLSAHQPGQKTINWKNIYLDINIAWTESELYKLQSVLSGHTVYAFSDGMPIKLDKDNWSEVTGKMRSRNFSLFPFHAMTDPEHALVVTKGKPLSPHLADFDDSAFALAVMGFFEKGKRVHVFNLDGGVSTYISSLREFRAVEFTRGDAEVLKMLLEKNVFPAVEESAGKIVVHDAGLAISKTKAEPHTAQSSNAPDHAARLFAYNDIMRKLGTRKLSSDFVNQDLIDEAHAAYVVSPVSSLIVLEKQEDYERFGIDDKGNSLHNASKDASGAVPEPHEWALIMLFVLFVLYTVYRSRRVAHG